MKKFLTVLGMLLLLVIVVGGGLYGMMNYKGRMLDKESKAFVDNTIPKILTNWDADAFNQYSDHAAMQKTGVTDEQVHKYFAWSSKKLGNMKEYDGAKGQVRITYSGSSEAITATYQADAKFQKADALINVILLKDADGWKIAGLHLDSPAYATK